MMRRWTLADSTQAAALTDHSLATPYPHHRVGSGLRAEGKRKLVSVAQEIDGRRIVGPVGIRCLESAASPRGRHVRLDVGRGQQVCGRLRD